MFSEDDSWRPEALAGGACPEAAMVRQQLLELVELGMENLPPNTARVFLMREFLDFEFSEIAAELSLSEGNLCCCTARACACAIASAAAGGRRAMKPEGTLTCRDTTWLVSDARDRALSALEMERLRRHIDGCPHCRIAARQFVDLFARIDELLARRGE